MNEDEARYSLLLDDIEGLKAGLRTQRRRLIILLVFTVVVVSLLTAFSASLRQQKCGQRYAAAQYAAQTPIDAAQKQLNAADATIWEITQKVFTQTATPKEYRELRVAVKQRNTLWEQLRAEQEAHPVPPPPDQFC